MKKALYIIASVFEIALLAGAWIIQYFTRRKMGMARYVVYKNHGWEAEYPMQFMQYAAVAVILILTVIVSAAYVKCKNQRSIQMTVMLVATILLSALYVGFTFMSGTDSLRAYYFIDGMFALAAFVQTVKALLRIIFSGNPKTEAVRGKKGK